MTFAEADNGGGKHTPIREADVEAESDDGSVGIPDNGMDDGGGEKTPAKAAAVDGTADTPSPVTGTLPRSIIESIANVFSIKKPKRPIEHEPISP
jgi:hypothetical protein